MFGGVQRGSLGGGIMFGQGDLGELALGQIGGSEFALPPLPTFIRNIPALLDHIRSASAILYNTQVNPTTLAQIRSAVARLTQ